jgi:hypothetical protein
MGESYALAEVETRGKAMASTCYQCGIKHPLNPPVLLLERRIPMNTAEMSIFQKRQKTIDRSQMII